EVVLRSVVEGPHPLRVSGLTPGLRGAAHCRASGKAMLAYLEESELLRYLRTHSLAPLTDRSITDVQRLREDLERIAQQGFAEDLGEFAPDICCVAAPYFDAQGKVAGALTISMPLFRHSQKGPQVAAAVLAAGEQASRAMGYAGSYPPHK
ncbi:MAG: IclR family transcriptional regulator, partial [Firmicutes bacterium]|nr:IclR family transcriptional regulator [Bacillota bacterium]